MQALRDDYETKGAGAERAASIDGTFSPGLAVELPWRA